MNSNDDWQRQWKDMQTKPPAEPSFTTQVIAGFALGVVVTGAVFIIGICAFIFYET